MQSFEADYQEALRQHRRDFDQFSSAVRDACDLLEYPSTWIKDGQMPPPPEDEDAEELPDEDDPITLEWDLWEKVNHRLTELRIKHRIDVMTPRLLFIKCYSALMQVKKQLEWELNPNGYEVWFDPDARDPGELVGEIAQGFIRNDVFDISALPRRMESMTAQDAMNYVLAALPRARDLWRQSSAVRVTLPPAPHKPTPATDPGHGGEWSDYMPLSEMRTRAGFNGNRSRGFEVWRKSQHIEKLNNGSFRIRLDTLDPATRNRFEA